MAVSALQKCSLALVLLTISSTIMYTQRSSLFSPFPRELMGSVQRKVTAMTPSPGNDSIRLPFDSDIPAMAEVKLLIVTYMRSGSTFTGDMFSQNPEAFYVFEPLHTITNTKHMLYFWDKNPVLRKDVTSKQMASAEDDVISGYLNCSFKSVLPAALRDDFLGIGPSTRPFYWCIRQQPGLMGALECLPLLQRSCRQARATVLKTIRMSFATALDLMERDPKVKVIHLVRDPRGTLRSQQRYKGFTRKTVRQFSRDFCQTVEEDLRVGRAASERFPGRVLRVRYEDLARHPLSQARRLLTFAGLTLDDAQRRHIVKVTQSSTRLPACAACINVLRTNSTAEAFAWRHVYGFDFTSAIDEQCAEVYRLAGYRKLSVEQLRDLNFSSIVEANLVDGF